MTYALILTVALGWGRYADVVERRDYPTLAECRSAPTPEKHGRYRVVARKCEVRR